MSTEKHYIVFKQAYYLLTVCTKVDILMSCIKIGENGKEGDEQQGKRKAVLTVGVSNQDGPKHIASKLQMETKRS